MNMRSLIFHLFAIVAIQALENPIPSSFLPPRDFNPHPYQEEARRFVIAYTDEENIGLEKKLLQKITARFRNLGPVKFPEDQSFNYLQQQRREQQRKALSHIVDNQAIINTSYEPLPITRRPPPHQTRFTNTADQHQILAALANHAKRVQNNEFQRNTYTPTYTNNRIDDDDEDEEDHVTDHYRGSPSNFNKKEYNFAYAVKDHHSGDDFSHSQKQENGAVQGSYKVRLPDNRIQITKYVADEKGYRAEVIYEEDDEAPHEIPQIQHEQQHHLTYEPEAIQIRPKVYYQQQSVKPINQNHKPRFTVTPTPYFNSEYSHVQAPSIRKSYPSTTALPHNRYY